METTELKRNTGFLHVSTEKTQEKSPDYFGSMDIDGIEYKLGGWKKQAEKSDSSFIAINLDLKGHDHDTAAKVRQDHLDQFNKDRKKKENKDKFLLIEQTGTIHKSKPDRKEDFFGKVLIGGVVKYLVGFASQNKAGNPMIRLEVSEGLRSKEERTELAEKLL